MDSLRFDTNALAESERVSAYRGLYSPAAEVRATGPRFHAAFEMTRLDQCIVYERRLTDVEHERTARMVIEDGFDHIVASVLLEGHYEIDTAGSVFVVPVGAISVLDLTCPMISRARDVRMVTLSISRDCLSSNAIAAVGERTATIEGPMASFLRDHLVALLQNAQQMDARQGREISRATARILDATLCVGDSHTAHPHCAMSEDASLLDFLEANLSDTTLDANRLVALSGRSRATIYRRFKRYGGLSKYIRTRRLRQLAIGLSKSDGDLETLAAECGFASAAQASRSFYDFYRIRPGDYRGKLHDNPGIDMPKAFLDIVLAEVLSPK
jgi:AraC-like DNA-binding protein